MIFFLQRRATQIVWKSLSMPNEVLLRTCTIRGGCPCEAKEMVTTGTESLDALRRNRLNGITQQLESSVH